MGWDAQYAVAQLQGQRGFQPPLAKSLKKFSKQKSSQSASMQLQIAMNIFCDLKMQCLHCFSNAQDRITPLICRQMISC